MKDEFQIDDIVEVLNLTPEQTKHLDATYLVGMKYYVEKIWPPKTLLNSQLETWYILRGFPLNGWGDTTFFTKAQLRLYHRPDISLERISKMLDNGDFAGAFESLKGDEKMMLLQAQYRNATRQSDLGIIDSQEFGRVEKRLVAAFRELLREKGGEG